MLLRLYNREVTFLFGYVTVNGNVYSSDSDAASIVSSKFSGSSASSSSSASLISTSAALSEDFSESSVVSIFFVFRCHLLQTVRLYVPRTGKSSAGSDLQQFPLFHQSVEIIKSHLQKSNPLYRSLATRAATAPWQQLL